MNLETKNYKSFRIGNVSFENYSQANRCLKGDTVEWDGSKCILNQRANHRTLIGVLELNSKYIYGHTSRGAKIYLFHPMDPAYPPMRVGCSERDTSHNQLALVKFSEWTETLPRGNLIRLLGPVGDLDAERIGLQWLYGRPEFKALSFDLQTSLQRRTRLEEGTINIDPEGCLDIDDVLTLQPSEEGWNLWITIADVAESIPANSPGDILASERAQTLYQNGFAALPMLPKEVSENSLSLLPLQERQGIALHCIWTGSTLQHKGFEEVTVVNQKSYTYESIYSSSFPTVVLKEIASYLKGEETNDSHEWIAQLMLLYNLEGAKMLLKGKSGLLRTHALPVQEKLVSYEMIHPDLRIFAFESAKYELAEEGKVHATLGSQPYTHLSSPLRRYADLVNQRVLKAMLRGVSSEPLPSSLPTKLNEVQKNLKRHDRDLFFLQQILKAPTGSLDGLVVDSTESKVKVYVPQWKRIVSVNVKSDCQALPGSQVCIDYYADLKKVSWKERIVFRLKN